MNSNGNTPTNFYDLTWEQLKGRVQEIDASENLDLWECDPTHTFPERLKPFLRPDDLERVNTMTYEDRIAHRNRTGFVVPATDSRGRNGWFPIGQVSTFAGFSGAGKTKLVLQMLDAMRTGEKFLGDKAVPKKSVLWFQQDRSLEQLHDAYEDICDSREPWFLCIPPLAETGGAALLQIEQILARHDHPEVCVVDGMDIVIPDTRGHAIKDLFPKAQGVAGRAKTALIALWGSPKRQATKDAYTDSRLAASGSAEIGRLSATAAVVTKYTDDENRRKLVVDTHRSAAETYELMFRSREDGWLRQFDPIALAKIKAAGSTDPITLLKSFGLDWSDVAGVLEKGISRASWFRKGKDSKNGKS